jgi:hypothetical protein
MDRQALTGNTVVIKSREMAGRSQKLPWWLGGEGVKTTEKKYIGPVGSPHRCSSAKRPPGGPAEIRTGDHPTPRHTPELRRSLSVFYGLSVIYSINIE